MTEFAIGPAPLTIASPASGSVTVQSDSSPRPSLIPLVSFSISSPNPSSTRTFFPSSNPPPTSFKANHHKKRAPLTPIPTRLPPSASSRENDSSQVNRLPPSARLVASPSVKQRDEKVEAMRLLCQRSMGEVRGERRVAGRSDKQYSDDMLVLGQLPALIEAGLLAGTMDRVFRLIADSIENPRSKQASTALSLLPSLLASNVQAATASASTLLGSLLHCYLHGEKFLQREVPPLLHQCMTLSGGRSVSCFGAKERGASKNGRERAICACLVHAVLSLFTASTFTAYEGCTSCPTTLHSLSPPAFSVAALPLVELTTVLATLHAFVSDGQASTRYHARHAISLLCTHASPTTLDIALKALPFEHALSIKAIAPTPSPTSSPQTSPPSSTRPRHNTMPSPPPPPSASPPRAYATLPDEREWEEWKQQPGLVSPIKTDPPPDTEGGVDVIAATECTPRLEERDEDDEVVVRVHTARAAVSPVPFVGDDEDEEDEITVVIAAEEKQTAARDDAVAAVTMEEPVVVTVMPSASETQLITCTVTPQPSAIASEPADAEAANQTDHTTPTPTAQSPPVTPARSSSTEPTRLSTKRKRSDSPPPADAVRDADKEQSLCITSATQWLLLCNEAELSSNHKRVVEVSTAAMEWLATSRQEAADRRRTEQCVAAAERQMSRMSAMMERVKASADVLRRTMRAESAAE